MIGRYDARTSLLSYDVVTSRRGEVIQMSAASLCTELLAGVCEENYPGIPAAAPLRDRAPASCSPWAGKGASVGGEGKFALSYAHSPTMLHKGEEWAEGTMQRPPCLFGWGGCVSPPG